MKPIKPFRRILTLLPLLTLVMSLNQCSCSDTLGSLFITEQDEASIGAQFDSQLRTKTSEYPVFQANTAARQQFKDYAEGVFRKVLANVPANQKPSYNFKLTLIDQPVINAFAVPGGYVYLYTGIVDSMRSESELAGVLGHEMAHITRHHYRDAMLKTVGINLVIDALSGGDTSQQFKKAIANMFTQLAELKVSRENESDADSYGTRYIAYTGYNAFGIADLFSRMNDPGLEWLSTHPAPSTRVDDVRTLVRSPEGNQWDTSSVSKYSSPFLTQQANLHR